ncbi:hypothetical protein HPB49_003900 [Dermacentor silvarum]|uniref:Uncharacterized protein n=1 Tax=Dermacentor silvarum TaxID=543639 RepID=A0ACB8DMT1_DERSI|nr:hypothetical protein HPB49_003900 [Dermacentor silvarum]
MAASHENEVDRSGSVIDIFLDAIQQHPCFYYTKRADYRVVDRKNNAWELIRLFSGLSTGASMSTYSHFVYIFKSGYFSGPVEKCLKQWKRLRDRYTRELKAIEQTNRSGSGCVSRRAWEFVESMAFY